MRPCHPCLKMAAVPQLPPPLPPLRRQAVGARKSLDARHGGHATTRFLGGCLDLRSLWCMPGFGANRGLAQKISALLQDSLPLSAVSRVRGRLQNPGTHQTLVETLAENRGPKKTCPPRPPPLLGDPPSCDFSSKPNPIIPPPTVKKAKFFAENALKLSRGKSCKAVDSRSNQGDCLSVTGPGQKDTPDPEIWPKIKNEKAAQRVSFGAGYPADVHADIPADVPGQKLRSSPRNPAKTSISVRTSMTRRRGRP